MIKRPEILSDEQIAQHIRGKVDNPVYWMNSWLIDFAIELQWVAQAQNDYCYKEMLGQIASELNAISHNAGDLLERQLDDYIIELVALRSQLEEG